MRNLTKAVLLFISMLPASFAAAETCERTIKNSERNGGLVHEFDEMVRKEQCLVRIEGLCVSACTMFLGAKRVCVSPSASLIFHPPKIHLLEGTPKDHEPYYFMYFKDMIKAHYTPGIALWYEREVAEKGKFGKIQANELWRQGYEKCPE